ncbi:MAG: exodeoxyribonuclease V subunit alpha [Desulfuromonadales bacterium]|nr:exodeoxyribonuclease V subunit alpha [Desulfuromonadales bacterium]
METLPNHSPLAEAFAALLVPLCAEGKSEVAHAARLVCEAMRSGHVCLDLRALGDAPLPAEMPATDLTQSDLTPAEWRAALTGSGVVGAPGDVQPLILDNADRLYLYRYWRYEQQLAEALLALAQPRPLAEPERLRAELDRLFPVAGSTAIDWQRVAAALAATRSLCVISGGPGTGKTTTVVKILALLLTLSEQPLRIALAAPTGKAAARLKTAINTARQALPSPAAIRDLIPAEVRTLHRLLGPLPRSQRFRHNQDTPLPYDLVVVDEASMVDLPLMTKLVTALPAGARLILLGDKNQLASVEAGAVLGDICRTGSATGYSTRLRQDLDGVLHLPDQGTDDNGHADLADSLVTLHTNYRFAATSGIGTLSRLINTGEATAALALFREPHASDLDWVRTPGEERLATELERPIVDGFRAYLTAKSAGEALRAFGRYMLLCALRNGPYGVERINALAERILARHGLIRPDGRWYHGRPLMIVSNSERLGLFNGDTGILWPEDGSGDLKAHFLDATGELRTIATARLPAHETAFATTVHKSQGSEYDHVLLLLPPHDSRVLTRELLYTGITRARQSVCIWGEESLFVQAVRRRVQRSSGLREALWGREIE